MQGPLSESVLNPNKLLSLSQDIHSERKDFSAIFSLGMALDRCMKFRIVSTIITAPTATAKKRGTSNTSI
jgi:hypothetical protein